ncbi:MAG: adenosine deaminase [Pseudomonadota bacterium]
MQLIDLHRHLDGNIRVDTIIDLAKQHNLPLSNHTTDSLRSLVYIREKTSDLIEFLTRLDYGVSVLASPQDCYRVAYENVEDAFNEGLDYVELRFSPHYMASAHGLSLDDVVSAVSQGVKDGCVDYPVNANLIGILSRTFGVDSCYQELNAILRQKHAFVAVDLAGDESGFPPDLFVDHFKRVRDAELQATVHAGEAGGAENVWTAIHKLHARRIGHGVNAIHDAALIDYLAENAIGVESCLTSNYQTATWTDMPTHPLRDFLRAGVEVCLCTDDPGVSNITLRDEYNLARSELQLTDAQLHTLAINAKSQAFALDD